MRRPGAGAILERIGRLPDRVVAAGEACVDRKTEDVWANVMRWSGRVLALLTAGLFLLFLFEAGARVFPALAWSRPEQWPAVIALVVAVLGLVAAWRWELVGGILAFVGSLAIVLLVVLGSGPHMLVPALVFVAPLVLAGLLYLGCTARCRATARRHEG